MNVGNFCHKLFQVVVRKFETLLYMLNALHGSFVFQPLSVLCLTMHHIRLVALHSPETNLILK